MDNPKERREKLQKLAKFMGKQNEALTEVLKSIQGTVPLQKHLVGEKWQDYTPRMWEWIAGAMVMAVNQEDAEDYDQASFVQEIRKITDGQLTPEWESMLESQHRAMLAFNIMMNHIGEYPLENSSIMASKAIRPACTALMFDMPTLLMAFEVWIYG